MFLGTQLSSMKPQLPHSPLHPTLDHSGDNQSHPQMISNKNSNLVTQVWIIFGSGFIVSWVQLILIQNMLIHTTTTTTTCGQEKVKIQSYIGIVKQYYWCSNSILSLCSFHMIYKGPYNFSLKWQTNVGPLICIPRAHKVIWC